ncbi:hypothetical protein PAHAL_2G249100 [Panicum hallii]|uniref:Uncharacterized protein n=1 Tax=Panicum hallii TaxID=206008 RepID=A0A2S3GZE3_9POAL|nr:uncharacterized protein LOC112882540 [Panicum hallii]PAN12202.1 hypothetical protein PAHAL_2G249100 [Panicum hallii]
MERFAAMVSSRRAAPAPAAAASAAPGPDEEEVKENAKGKLTAEDEAYLRIQLEEIVVVKNEDVSRLAAAHGSNYLGGATSRACAPGVAAAAAAAAGPAGSSAGTGAAAAARGALSTTVGWIVGSN